MKELTDSEVQNVSGGLLHLQDIAAALPSYSNVMSVLGSSGGRVIGYLVGSAFPPFGSAIGSAIGKFVGTYAAQYPAKLTEIFVQRKIEFFQGLFNRS